VRKNIRTAHKHWSAAAVEGVKEAARELRKHAPQA
jgi:hypothetical protein